MSGLEKMIDRIKEKADRERKSILEEAEEKAERKKQEKMGEAEKRKKEIIQEGKEEAEMMERRRLAGARREGRQDLLKAREEVIQEVFEGVEERLSELREEDRYEDILGDLVVEGGIAVGGGDLEVLLSEDDEEILDEDDLESLSERMYDETGNETNLELVPELQDVMGGAVVRRKDGSVSCENTLGARLERMRKSLRKEVAGILFEEGT